MNHLKILISSLFLCLACAACVPNPNPMGASSNTSSPGPIPTVGATPFPGQMANQILPMTVLGPVPCSGNVAAQSGFIIRNMSEWNAYMANTACGNPSNALNLSSFNFAAQSVVIMQYEDCGNVLYRDIFIWNVYEMGGYLYANVDITFNNPTSGPSQIGCNSVAVAIPATSEGMSWCVCYADPSYHCFHFVTP